MEILKRFYIAVSLIALCGIFCAAQTAHEYKVQAASLFHFSCFVDWPASAFETPKSPIVIGVVGKNPFGDALDQLVEDTAPGAHPIEIQYFETAADITACHILYINLADTKAAKAVVQKMAGQNVLTVSHGADFTDVGGMIRLYTENAKMKIQINTAATKSEGLTVSTKLLKLAEVKHE